MTQLQHTVSRSIDNTLALPCVAHGIFSIRCAGDLEPALQWSATSGLPLLPMGEGSNVVLPDELQAGVLRVTDDSVQTLSESPDHIEIRVGAGKNWHALVGECLADARYGLENLALIPGLCGAAPVQNIGAYGRELAEFVTAVHGVSLSDGSAQTLNADQCAFSYRSSVFKEQLRDRFLITSLDLRLNRSAENACECSYPALAERMRGQKPTPELVYQAVVALRQERLPDPRSTPNAGSFFKNPFVEETSLAGLRGAHPELPVFPQVDGRSKLPAAWLIDRCGLRGYSSGGAAVSQTHALVIETNGRAKQQDVLAVADHVKACVRDRFDIALECEPRIYG